MHLTHGYLTHKHIVDKNENTRIYFFLWTNFLPRSRRPYNGRINRWLLIANLTNIDNINQNWLRLSPTNNYRSKFLF